MDANCTDVNSAFNDTLSLDYHFIDPKVNVTLDQNSNLGKVTGNPSNDTICLSNNTVCLGDSQALDFFQFISVFNESVQTNSAHAAIGLAPSKLDDHKLKTFMYQLEYFYSMSPDIYPQFSFFLPREG